MPGPAAPSIVLALALLLSGCAGLIGGKQPVSVGAPSRPLPLPIPPGQGAFNIQKGRPGYVIGIPHGTTDIATDLIGLELARRTGFGAVVVTGEGGKARDDVLAAWAGLGYYARARNLLGHYDPAHNAIIVSRIFDHPKVPRYAVEYIVYHEMLHLKHPVRLRGSRRCVHSREFQAEEKLYPQLEEAKRFLKNL